MKVGEKVSAETMEMIASGTEMEAGVVRIKHPRCGRVVIRRKGATWVVTECERPDGAKK